MTSWSSYSVGAPPNADNDVMAWASEAATSPMPVKGTFKNWRTIMSTYNDGENGFSIKDTNTLAKSFEANLNTYCVDWLLKRGAVDSCVQRVITAAEKAAAIADKYADNTKNGNFNGNWK